MSHCSKTCQILKCVFIHECIHIELLTDSVNKVHFRGSMYSKKELTGRFFFFSNTGLQGPGRVSPGGSSSPAPPPLAFLFGVSRLTSEFVQYHQKASVKIQLLEGKIQIIPWQGMLFFNQHCFTKVIDTYYRLWWKRGKQLSVNTIGKKHTHFGNRKHTTLP